MAISALMTALAVALLYISSLIPGMRLSLCAIAGLPVALAVIKCGRGYGFGVWAAASAIGLFVPPLKAPGVIFALFFGLYPVLKSIFEMAKIGNLLSYVLKFTYFLSATAAAFGLAHYFGLLIGGRIEILGIGLALADAQMLAVAVAVAALFVYDFALGRLIGLYIGRFSN